MPVPGAAAELARVPLFEQVDPAVLTPLDEVAFLKRVARNQVLFVDGEPADHLFVLRRGALKVHLVSELGAELLLALLGPGAVLGDVSMIDAGPRSAAVTAVADSELLAVPAADVRALLRAQPDVLWAVAQGLAGSMRRLTRQTADLVFLDLPRRLASLLLDSAVAGPDGQLIANLLVNQSDLAAMLGVTRQSLNKALGGLTARGWIDVVHREVRLLDPHALRRFTRS